MKWESFSNWGGGIIAAITIALALAYGTLPTRVAINERAIVAGEKHDIVQDAQIESLRQADIRYRNDVTDLANFVRTQAMRNNNGASRGGN